MYFYNFIIYSKMTVVAMVILDLISNSDIIREWSKDGLHIASLTAILDNEQWKSAHTYKCLSCTQLSANDSLFTRARFIKVGGQ